VSDVRWRKERKERSKLTRLGWEGVLVVEKSLDPGEDVIDVGWCRKSDLSLVGVYPGEVESVGIEIVRWGGEQESQRSFSTRVKEGRWNAGTEGILNEPYSCRHGRASLDGVVLDDDPVEVVEVVEEVVNWEGGEVREMESGEGKEGSELIFFVSSCTNGSEAPSAQSFATQVFTKLFACYHNAT